MQVQVYGEVLNGLLEMYEDGPLVPFPYPDGELNITGDVVWADQRPMYDRHDWEVVDWSAVVETTTDKRTIPVADEHNAAIEKAATGVDSFKRPYLLEHRLYLAAEEAWASQCDAQGVAQ